MCGIYHFLGLWRLPGGQASNNDLNYWVELAKLLEGAKFDGIFISDTLGLYDVYKGPGNIAPALQTGAQVPYSDPRLVVHEREKIEQQRTFLSFEG